MKILINIFLILLAIVLQISFMPKIGIMGFSCNIILVIFLSLICIKRNKESLWWAGIGGLMMDLISPLYFGIYTTVFLLIFFIVSYLMKHIFSERPIVIIGLIFVFASIILNLPFAILNHYYLPIIIELIYSVVFGLIIYSLLNYLFKPEEEVKI